MDGPVIVGREDELVVLDTFLDGVEHGPTALVLVGEAGIGTRLAEGFAVNDVEGAAQT